jgi:hypothetical protein
MTNMRKTGDFPNIGQAEFTSPYRLDSSRVDVNLARKLYYNTDPRYKLGAGFARPAIDVPVGFMGVPRLMAEDKVGEGQEWLDRFTKDQAGNIIKAHKMALRDGEVLLRLRPKYRASAYQKLFGADDKDLEVALVPSEAFETIGDPEDNDALRGIKVKHVLIQYDSGGNPQEVVLFETVTADTIVLKYENDEFPRREFPNPMGFVPAVVLENEPERHQLHASSDLEPVEPYLKFYNDVMLHAGSASALHSTAKLVLRARDVERFVKNNFTDTEIDEKRLRFKNKDVLFFESGDPSINTAGSSIYAEGAEIIQASAPLGDTNTLLEFIFLNIVDVTEVPEWAFGGAIASSKASVGEQSAPLVHKVGRKRTMVEGAWALIGRMMLQTVTNTSERVTVEWDQLAMRDLKTEGEAFRNFSDSLIALNEVGIVSKITTTEILGKLNRDIIPYAVDDEKTEEGRISAELAEKQERAEQLMATMEPTDNEDRETGRSVVE